MKKQTKERWSTLQGHTVKQKQSCPSHMQWITVRKLFLFQFFQAGESKLHDSDWALGPNAQIQILLHHLVVWPRKMGTVIAIVHMKHLEKCLVLSKHQ
jgi:hypothetical protein